MNLRPTVNLASISNDVPSVFAVGNGPSLKGFDFSQLEPYDWVGMNAAYRYWERSGIYPTFYACLDLIVGESHKDAIIDMVARAGALGIKSFLLRDDLISTSDRLQSNPLIVNFDHYFKDMPERILDLITTGSHAALWMHELNYKHIILLGIDVNYVELVPGAQSIEDAKAPHKLKIIREDENTNYFIPDYQQVDDSYTVPNPEPDVHKAAWRRVKAYIDKTDSPTKLYNGSEVSQLDCIDFINVPNFLTQGSTKVKTVREHMERRAEEGAEELGMICRLPGTLRPSSLAYFLHALLPVHYGNILINNGSHAKRFPGWVTHHYSASRMTQWSGLYLTAEDYLHRPIELQPSGFVVMEMNIPDQTAQVIESLFMDFDAIYTLTELDNSIELSQYVGASGGAPSYILAFTHQRFWNHTAEAALKSAVEPIPEKIETGLKRGLIKRRLRFYFKSLKSKLGL